MLKFVLAGVWIALVTAGSAYLAPLLAVSDPSSEPSGADVAGVEHLKSDMTSVPVVRGGAILGYVIIQLNFAARRSELEHLKLEPGPYLVDAAFRTIFSNPQIDFRHPRPSEIDTLTSEIAKAVNARVGADLVRDVLIEQLNFVNKDEIRTNWIGSKAPGSH